MSEYERIDSSAIVWHSVMFNESHTYAASPYGDPELALASLEETSDYSTWTNPEMAMMTRLLGILPERVRVIVALDAESVPQAEIGRRLGISQPSVSYMLGRVKAWLALVYPLRLALSAEPDPLTALWAKHPKHVAYWRDVVLWHRPKYHAAEAVGRAVWGLDRRVLGDVKEHGTETQRAIVQVLQTPGRCQLWSYPGVHTPRRLRDV